MKWYTFILIFFLFLFLTILTQIGGVLLLLSIYTAKRMNWRLPNRLKSTLIFLLFYCTSTFLIIPYLAPLFGRTQIPDHSNIQAVNSMSILLNRNYVSNHFSDVLINIADQLKQKEIMLSYLDGNFPFLNGFPLLPHLSHNDGKKLDIAFIYTNEQGIPSQKQISNSGYGVFEYPSDSEFNQTTHCKKKGFWQYDYPKYLTFGSSSEQLAYSSKYTEILLSTILKQKEIQKVFIEPHLIKRMQIRDSRIRFHGCQAVRHDDHIHIQID